MRLRPLWRDDQRHPRFKVTNVVLRLLPARNRMENLQSAELQDSAASMVFKSPASPSCCCACLNRASRVVRLAGGHRDLKRHGEAISFKPDIGVHHFPKYLFVFLQSSSVGLVALVMAAFAYQQGQLGQQAIPQRMQFVQA